MSAVGLRAPRTIAPPPAVWLPQDEQLTPPAWAEQLLGSPVSVAFLVGDLLVVTAAFILAFWVRFVAPQDLGSALGLETYIWLGVAVSAVTVVLLATHGMYDPDRPKAWAGRLQTIATSVSTALVLTVAVAYFIGEQSYSRVWFAAGWLLAVAGLMGWRALANTLYAVARDRLAPANRVLVVGANALGRQIARELADGYQVVGFVDNGSDLAGETGVPLLGTIAQLERLVHAYAVNELIIALPASRREQVSRLIARGFSRQVHVKMLPDLGDFVPERWEVHQVNGRPYIGFAPAARVTWAKRVLDVLLTAVGLLAISPLLLGIAVLVKLDSPGPIFYSQKRVGRHGQEFKMIKFRSMHVNADQLLAQLKDQNEASGPLFKMRNDPRVTRVGRVLRRLSLDELPQLFNVLQGHMSLVGPRPPIPSEVAEYEDWQFGRLRAVPGITGLWQVSGRSEVPFHDMVRLDLHYIRNWSLRLDLEILARTLPAVLTSRGAY